VQIAVFSSLHKKDFQYLLIYSCIVKKMLNGREKVGEVNFNYQEFAFGKGKYRRKTWGFGKYNKKDKSWSDFEINIREISIIEGALGCAVWDAGVIMSRWAYANKDLFANQEVIELGSGCGLPGFVVSRYCKSIVLTDYIDQVLENLTYNLQLNYGENEEDESKQSRAEYLKRTKVQYLNWDLIDTDPTNGIPLEQADIIMGSELTYSPLSVETLVKVIKKYLKPNGVFYEVLSDDRDGVGLFMEKIKAEGYDVNIHPVPEQHLGNFGTHQRPETYKFYTFKKPTSTYPDMQ